MLDDLIDIQRDWEKVSNPLGDIADSLVDPSKAHVFNPAEYKGKPRPSSVYCLRIASGREDVCSRCLDICPVDAIEIGDKMVKIGDNCRLRAVEAPVLAACVSEDARVERTILSVSDGLWLSNVELARKSAMLTGLDKVLKKRRKQSLAFQAEQMGLFPALCIIG